ncbi:hypothetical protein SS50377_24963 [Spironucleus salmonicida]|uniref:Uncharacterized protein n=1 Tax=Spironucleus salmonicida TaxID=348837 RepID=V6LGQ0_9EUKA|nr:hypothetical protein SS50377_24963 [Spironucleus salmonicida]|eukprot:EST43488.1 Hypothetical protein SS50377_16864 [Spironucleus salmonicida]
MGGEGSRTRRVNSAARKTNPAPMKRCMLTCSALAGRTSGADQVCELEDKNEERLPPDQEAVELAEHRDRVGVVLVDGHHGLDVENLQAEAPLNQLLAQN